MTNLTQSEANYLLALVKVASDTKHRIHPGPGGKVEVPLQSLDEREKFLLNIYRGRKLKAKVTWQTRTRSVFVLARLDFGAEHRNPDGTVVGSPHLHIYREGYGHKWAHPIKAGEVDENGFTVPTIDAEQKEWFDYFLEVCRIKNENIVSWRHGDLL